MSAADHTPDVPGLAGALLRHIRSSELDSREWLLHLIGQVDSAFAAVPPPEVVNFVRALLARATSAVGPLMKGLWPGADENIAATTRAAERYVAAPSHENDLAFFDAATQSFPFGPGDGCLDVDAIGGHRPGGGCRSGAGFLWHVAEDAGHAEVRARLVAALEAWLSERCEAD